MPAIAQIVLILPALAAADKPLAGWRRPASVRTVLGLGLLALGLYLGCWASATRPVAARRALIASGDAALVERHRPDAAERDYRAAEQADPLSSEPPERLAELSLQRWLAAGQPDDEELFERSLYWRRRAIAANPRHSGGYRALGAAYMARYSQTRDRGDAGLAAEALAQAERLYPTHAGLESELALALWHAGEASAAQAFAQWALELDALNREAGHIDKLLSDKRREMLSAVIEGRSPEPNELTPSATPLK